MRQRCSRNEESHFVVLLNPRIKKTDWEKLNIRTEWKNEFGDDPEHGAREFIRSILLDGCSGGNWRGYRCRRSLLVLRRQRMVSRKKRVAETLVCDPLVRKSSMTACVTRISNICTMA